MLVVVFVVAVIVEDTVVANASAGLEELVAPVLESRRRVRSLLKNAMLHHLSLSDLWTKHNLSHEVQR